MMDKTPLADMVEAAIAQEDDGAATIFLWPAIVQK